MVIYIKMTKKEKELIKNFARLKNMSMSTVIKNSIFHKIEDLHDSVIFDLAYLDYKKNPKTYSLEDIKKDYLK